MTSSSKASSPEPEDQQKLIGVDEARAHVLASVSALPVIDLPLLQSLGLVLGQDVIAVRDLPAFTNSAMDGFACRSEDIESASKGAEVRLRVTGTVLAGDGWPVHLEPGTAIRIMTGAALPDGADVVVPFERARVDQDVAWIHHAYPPGTNMRPQGEDMRAGSIVLASGTRIRPAEIALIAASGRSIVPVHRRPRVAILATGDEVVAPGESPGPGQIWDSNTDAIAAMILQAGGEPVPLGIARDVEADIRGRLSDQSNIDLLVTSGGVSAGDFDLVKDILQSDSRIEFWQVRMKPGRPLAFGSFGGIPLLGLPGNPVAAMVAFLQFGRPAIWKMLGLTAPESPIVEATMLDSVDNRGGRRHFVSVTLTRSATGYEARLAGSQGAAMLSSVSRADGFLVVPEAMESVIPGTRLQVELI